jgi:ABC-type transport system substrate-binding protein
MRPCSKFIAMIATALLLSACNGKSNNGGTTTASDPGGNGTSSGPKVLRLPMVTDGPKSMDPIRGSTVYENRACSQVYETLLQYKYLVRPLQLEPLLLSEMPTVSEDGLTYDFKLKKGVHFHDDACFAGGKGREMVAADVIYSWKRIADNDNQPKCWWLFEDTIVGFDEYRDQQNAAKEFDYNAPVEGLQMIDDHQFRVLLKRRVQRFLWVLAMYQTCVVPREAVDYYGNRFNRHPVGTGPFTMAEDDWIPKKNMVFNKNPNYRQEFYPDEYMPEDVAAGLTKAAGTRLPIVDRIEITFFVPSEPMWLQFRNKELDFTTVASEYFAEAFVKRTRKLRDDFRDEGIRAYMVPLMDFIFIGFNMEDELLGGYTDEKKNLRKAIALALDLEERNDAFYNGINIIYDGVIPPQLAGYPKDGVIPSAPRGPDRERAKELLAKAGYPNGEGLPEIVYYTGKGANAKEQTELEKRQLSAVGIRLNARLVDFSTLIADLNNKKAPMFSYAWGSDYPDGENNLSLFYGPNKTPGNNHFNYENEQFDELYRKILVMEPSAERTQIMQQMNEILVDDSPYLGSMARTRVYLANPWLKNFKPIEAFDNWYKYLDVTEH